MIYAVNVNDFIGRVVVFVDKTLNGAKRRSLHSISIR